MFCRVLILIGLATASIIHTAHARFVIEEALTQEELSDVVYETQAFTVYRIVPQPEKGFHWPYLILIGKNHPGEGDSTLYLETVNTGFSSDSYRVHEERGLNTLRNLFHRMRSFEDRLIFMMPVFLRSLENRMMYTHALDRDTMLATDPPYQRLDLQVLAMIEDAGQFLGSLGYETEEKFAIGGFSASGQFAQRFSMLHPDTLRFVIAGGVSGLSMFPIAEEKGKVLRYPVGVGDLEEITGEPFDREALVQLPRLLYFGSEDTNDSVKYRSAFAEEEKNVVFEWLGEHAPDRWLACIEVYQRWNTATQLVVDDGEVHKTSEAMFRRIMDFVEAQLAAE